MGWVNIACIWQIYIDIGLQLSTNPNILAKNMALSVLVDFMDLEPQGHQCKEKVGGGEGGQTVIHDTYLRQEIGDINL